jgi:hypothetical protein
MARNSAYGGKNFFIKDSLFPYSFNQLFPQALVAVSVSFKHFVAKLIILQWI